MKKFTEKPTILADYGKFSLFFALNEAHENHYNPSERFVADELILRVKRRGYNMRLHSQVLGGVPYKGEVQLDDAGAKAIHKSSRQPHKSYVH
jgi:hypothetical protein